MYNNSKSNRAVLRVSLTDASRIHHPKSFLALALVRARFIDADMIAVVLSLDAFVDVVTLGSVDLALLKALLARAHRGTVHGDADLLAAAVLILTRIGRSTGAVPRHVTRQAFAAEGSRDVDARGTIVASPVIVRAFVDVDAASLVPGQLVAGRTGAEVAADRVGADVGTLAVPLPTLVHVQAGGSVDVQVMSRLTGAHVAARQIHALVAAIVTIGQTLVHVHAVLPVVRQQGIAGGTLATITALGVHARVRAARFHVVLELLALVNVLAGPEILAFQTVTERAGASDARDCKFVGSSLFLMTVMRTIAVVALAAVHRCAGSVISLQDIFRWTQTPEGTYEIHARMRTSRVLAFAFVDVVAEGWILRILREAYVAGAVEVAGCVQTSMGTVVAQFQTLVDVDAGCVVPR